MKLLIKSMWIFVCLNSALLFANNERSGIGGEKVANILTWTLVVNAVVPLYIMLDSKEDVYVTSMLFVLVIYNVAAALAERFCPMRRGVGRHEKGIEMTFAGLTIINVIVAYQLMALEIERYDLFTHIFASYIIVLLIIHFFYRIRNRFEKEKLIACISLFAFFNAVLGIAQAYTGKALLISWAKNIDPNSGALIGRAVGFVGVSNAAGNLGAILFPVLLYKFWKDGGFANFAVLVLDVVFTIITFTRTGYIGILVECTIFAAFWMLKPGGEKLDIKKIVAAALAVGLFVGVSYFYLDDIVELYKFWFNARGDTKSMRIVQFKRAFSIFWEAPVLGVGSGQYAAYLMRTHVEYDMPIHSQWLNILVEQGAISFACYIAYNFSLFAMLARKYRGMHEELFLVTALFAGYNVVINFNTNQYAGINIYLFHIIVCGFLFSKVNRNGEGTQPQDVSAKLREKGCD